MKLHGTPLSHFTRKVRILLAELDVSFEMVWVRSVLASTPDADLVAIRAQADRDLIPYRSKMPSSQVEQLHKQYTHKRLLEKYKLPRLSLFYM